MSLSRKQCNELRGLAIVFIVLHNFIHQTRFGFACQNESSFHLERTQEFLDGFFSEGIWEAFCEFFSFLGWIGVPVFVFLSGYGLVKKNEQTSTPLKIWPYIKHNWLKLFFLMLPGVLFCALFNQFMGLGGIRVHLRYAGYLSMLGNLFGLDTMTPSIYWYFGLTFELYLAYIVLNRYPSKLFLGICTVLPVVTQIVLLYAGQNELVHFNLRNLIGWLPVFCTGVYLARYENKLGGSIHPLGYLFICIFSCLMLVLCNLKPWCWVLIHFVGLLFFSSLIQLFERIPRLAAGIAFIGSFASFIFACHPIARIIVNQFRSESWGLGGELLLYILLVIVLVPIYKLIVVKLTALVSCKHEESNA